MEVREVNGGCDGLNGYPEVIDLGSPCSRHHAQAQSHLCLPDATRPAHQAGGLRLGAPKALAPRTV